MKLVHASSNKFDKFDVFDYKKFHDNTFSNSFINNGNDSSGCGNYFLEYKGDETVNDVSFFGNIIYFVDLDINEDELLHNHSTELYYEYESAINDAIEHFMSLVRNENSFSFENFEKFISFVKNNIFDSENTIDPIQLNSMLKNDFMLNFEIDEYSNPADFDSFYDWEVCIKEKFDQEEPFSFINDEGGVECVMQYALDSSDNMGEFIKNLYFQFGVDKRNGRYQYRSYNKTFTQAINKFLPDFVAYKSTNSEILVVINQSKLKIESVFDYTISPPVDISDEIGLSHIKKRSKKNKL